MEAIELSHEERIAFLDRIGAEDQDLRRKVEALLKSNERVGNFLETPPSAAIDEVKSIFGAGEKPGDRVDKYKLLQQIGEGGCGIVFLADQERPVHRRVALKIIKPGMDTKSVIARFEAERQALALMDHPNIAKIFDAGTTESGRPFFVMELVQGVKITEYADQHSLTTQERLRLFGQVCEAVQHAHQKGIIHRDLKPSNILVANSADGKPAPKVIDFGIAKATTGQRLTDKTLFAGFEMLVGTPAYMSPEQAELSSLDVDTRTDVYSLGVVLYELLTGTTPFNTRELLKIGMDEVRRVIRNQDPVRPSTPHTTMSQVDLTTISKSRHVEPVTLVRAVRGDLDWIVMKALEKNRTRRYATAHDLARDIEHFLANEPVSSAFAQQILQDSKDRPAQQGSVRCDWHGNAHPGCGFDHRFHVPRQRESGIGHQSANRGCHERHAQPGRAAHCQGPRYDNVPGDIGPNIRASWQGHDHPAGHRSRDARSHRQAL